MTCTKYIWTTIDCEKYDDQPILWNSFSTPPIPSTSFPVLVKSAMKTNERKWLKHTCTHLECCLTSITYYYCGVHVLDQCVVFQTFGFEDHALD